MNWTKYWIAEFLIVLGFLLVCVVANAETVSLADLRYEIMENQDADKTGDERDNLYDTGGTTNHTKNELGYYNLSGDNGYDYLLCDTNFFNFTAYDEFYIEFYNPIGNDIYLEFLYSYNFGNDSDKNMNSVMKSKYLTNDGNDYYGHMFTDDWTMNHISLYYSRNDYMPHVFRSFIPFSGLAKDEDLEYKDASENISLENPDEGFFETTKITIRNNFNYFYPELRMFNEIWLTGVEEVYIRDFGFIVDDELEIQYTANNITYYMMYGENQFMMDHNQSNFDFPQVTKLAGVWQGLNDTNGLAWSPYDNDTQHFLSFNYAEYKLLEDLGADYIYNIYNFTLYGEEIELFTTVIPDSGLTATVGREILLKSIEHENMLYDVYEASTGQILFFNKFSTCFHYKFYFNVKEDDSDLVDGTTSECIRYIQEKQYYGFFHKNEVGNFSLTKTYDELEETDTELHNDDAVRTLSDVNVDKKEHAFYKLKGDWGAFDSIRKGINKILEVVQIAFEPVYESLVSIFDKIVEILTQLGVLDALETLVNSLVTPINNILVVVSGLVSDMISEIGTFFQPLLDDVTDIVTDVGQILTDFANLLIDTGQIVLDMAQVLIDLNSIIGILTLVGFIQDILNTLIAEGALIFAQVVIYLSLFVQYIGVLIELINVFLDFMVSLLTVYLLSVTLLTMFKFTRMSETDAGDIGEILREYYDLMVAPLIAFGKFVRFLLQTIFNAIPF